MFSIVLAAAAIAGCGAESDAADPVAAAGDDMPSASPTVDCAEPGAAVPVMLRTDDALQLEADLYPSGVVGGPAVVLLHMIPPSNDKSNYPPEFIDAVVAAGYTVLNVNRRGAGASQGDPKTAYEGPDGRLDAVAAFRFVTDDACQAPTDDVSFVAASNGTTTALDFALGDPSQPLPAALVFLSPGGYTENQHAVAEHTDRLGEVPILFGYPDSESAWPAAVAELSNPRWEFRQYDGGRHGSGLFATHPAIVDQIVDFLGER